MEGSEHMLDPADPTALHLLQPLQLHNQFFFSQGTTVPPSECGFLLPEELESESPHHHRLWKSPAPARLWPMLRQCAFKPLQPQEPAALLKRDLICNQQERGMEPTQRISV
ncbi:MAG: hypothetical protein DYG96_03610 [Chlorobi bacterium CHB2]|nr:hypothetical protein [Chlorobi bacterium CHB2]